MLSFLVEYGVGALFLLLFIEQLGLPLPAAPFLITAGGLAAMGDLPILGVILAAVGGCACADWVWYFLGRRQGMKVLQRLCRVAMEPTLCVRRTENTFARYGVRTLLGAKFVPGLNLLAAPLAGLFNIKPARFFLFDTAGVASYVGLYLALGFIFKNQVALVLAWVERFGRGAIGVVLTGIALYVVYKWFYRIYVLRSLRMARIKPEELQEKLDANERVTIVDLRAPMDLQELPYSIPGALQISPDELDRRHSEIPRDSEVVVYCACPNETTAAKVALRLRKKGIKNIRPLLGGLTGWRYQELPITPLGEETNHV